MKQGPMPPSHLKNKKVYYTFKQFIPHYQNTMFLPLPTTPIIFTQYLIILLTSNTIFFNDSFCMNQLIHISRKVHKSAYDVVQYCFDRYKSIPVLSLIILLINAIFISLILEISKCVLRSYRKTLFAIASYYWDQWFVVYFW